MTDEQAVEMGGEMAGMVRAEYEMTFGEWVNATKGEAVELDAFGGIAWRDPRKDEVTRLWHQVWIEQRKAFRLQEKGEQITHALEAIKANGFNGLLKCWDNGHILTQSKSGKPLSYYATTGTITGYRDTSISGLGEYIRLLREI